MGASHARLLAAEGVRRVIGGPLADEGHSLAGKPGRLPKGAAAAATAVRIFGPLNALVNNAGIINCSPLKTFDPDKWQKALDVNAGSIHPGFIRTAMTEKRPQGVLSIPLESSGEPEDASAATTAAFDAQIFCSPCCFEYLTLSARH